MNIRKAQISDLSRIAEIYVFNDRLNYLPIFKDNEYCFKKLQVISIIDDYFKKDEVLNQLYVYDDGLIKGFIQMDGCELSKMYVEPFFQSQGIGSKLIQYAIKRLHADCVWTIERNTRAIAFYEKNGFHLANEKKYIENTLEYEVLLKR